MHYHLLLATSIVHQEPHTAARTTSTLVSRMHVVLHRYKNMALTSEYFRFRETSSFQEDPTIPLESLFLATKSPVVLRRLPQSQRCHLSAQDHRYSDPVPLCPQALPQLPPHFGQ